MLLNIQLCNLNSLLSRCTLLFIIHNIILNCCISYRILIFILIVQFSISVHGMNLWEQLLLV